MFFLLSPRYKHRNLCSRHTHMHTYTHTHKENIRTHVRIRAHTRAPMDTHTPLLSNTSKIEEMTYLLYVFKSILPNELWISAYLLFL